MGGLIGITTIEKAGLMPKENLQLSATAKGTVGVDNYVHLGTKKTNAGVFCMEVLLIIGINAPTWNGDTPFVQILASTTDNSGNPNLVAANVLGNVTNNIYLDDDNNIYLKNVNTYGTNYSVTRLSSNTKTIIDLVMSGSSAGPKGEATLIL